MAMEERFKPLAPEEMTPEQRRTLDAILGGPRGKIEGPFKALLRSPDLADRVQRVGEYIRFRSSVPARLNELAILVTARKWTAQFEWWAHRRLAMQAGLKPAIADAIARGERPADMDVDEAAVHDFAHALVHSGHPSDAAFAALCDRLGEQGVIDVIGACGYYTLVSFVLNVERVGLPDGAAPPLEPI
jgi:4-carboxymuconolactone decarboxylase